MEVWNGVLILSSALVSIPMFVFVIECLLAMAPRRRALPAEARPDVAVLVPAHDEETVIAPTLANYRNELRPTDRLIVIADNCSDRTAEIAREAGAEVIERTDPHQRGKGYALAFGVDHLRTDPPEIVVILDADCTVVEGSIDRLAHAVTASGRPAQATYVMTPPKDPSPRDAVSAFAFVVKNRVRPRGLARLGLPCWLTGSGMAAPWSVLEKAPLASGAIVEDMKLGVDVAIAGRPALFCEDARIESELPASGAAATGQRRRWEHGHLQTILAHGPRLLWCGLRTGRVAPLALALDLAVPPLSLLVLVWIAVAVLSIVSAWISGAWTLVWFHVFLGSLLILAGTVAWRGFARDLVPLSALRTAPAYLLWKIPLYFEFLIRPQSRWVRTQRDS